MRTIDEIKANIEIVNSANAILGYPTDGTLITELRNELCLALTADIPLDRLEQICKAEKDGRCVVLPCKVGDTVYSYSWNIKTEKYDVVAGKVKNVRYDSADGTVAISNGERYHVWGKTVFLTREEAEEALKND